MTNDGSTDKGLCILNYSATCVQMLTGWFPCFVSLIKSQNRGYAFGLFVKINPMIILYQRPNQTNSESQSSGPS